MIDAWIGLGANLGDRAATLDAALARVDALAEVSVQSVSGFYFTPPWGDTNQPEFLNAVAGLHTRLSASALLQGLLAVESGLGRTRSDRRWGPRMIDLDLLLYGDEKIDEPGLTVPHPRLHQRAFVLLPLAELAPKRMVPGLGRVDALLARLADNERADIRPGPHSRFELFKNKMETR